MTKDSYVVRFATDSDIRAFYSEAMDGFKGLSLVHKGASAGVAGVLRKEGKLIAVSAWEAPIPRPVIYRCAMLFAEFLDSFNEDIYIIRDIMFSGKLLRRMGFRLIEGDAYVWPFNKL